jgi:hypothetical protein
MRTRWALATLKAVVFIGLVLILASAGTRASATGSV